MSIQNSERRYVTITKGGAGYFATLIWWNPDMGGFYEPYDTGVGRYRTQAEAVPEAVAWAEAEGIPFELRGYDARGRAAS